MAQCTNSMVSRNKSLAPFYIVEFVSRGRKPAVKKVDIVAGSWLFFNNKLKKCSTKYPDPPYSELQDYLENLKPASPSWSSFTVRLRGRANSLEEATNKLNKLNEEESVLTLESEENLSDVEREEISLVRKDKFFEEASTFTKTVTSLQQPTPSVEQTRHVSNNLVDDLPDTVFSSALPPRQKLDRQEKQRFQPLKEITTNHENIDGISFDDFGCEEIENTHKKLKTKETDVRSHSSHLKRKLPLESSFQSFVTDFLNRINANINSLKNEIRENRNEIQHVKALLLQRTEKLDDEFICSPQQLACKYSIDIPLTSINSFLEFDELLNDSKSAIYSDTKAVLLSGLNRELSISKSFVNMLKLFFTQNTAKSFVAVKKTKDKIVLKSTNFYSCMEKIIKEKRQQNHLDIDNKLFNTALSAVLSNVNAWKKKTDETQSNKEVTYEVEHEKSDDDLLGTYDLLPVSEDEVILTKISA